MLSDVLHSETCLVLFLSYQENFLFGVLKYSENTGMLEKTAVVRQLIWLSEDSW